MVIEVATPLVAKGTHTFKEVLEETFNKVKDKGVAEGTVRAQLYRGLSEDGKLNKFEFIIDRDSTSILSFSKNRPVKPAK